MSKLHFCQPGDMCKGCGRRLSQPAIPVRTKRMSNLVRLTTQEPEPRRSQMVHWTFGDITMWVCSVTALGLVIMFTFVFLKWHQDAMSRIAVAETRVEELKKEIEVTQKLMVIHNPFGCSMNMEP
jgi:hypothetical protein